MAIEDWQVRAYDQNVHHRAQELKNKAMGTTREKTARAVMIGFSTMEASEGVTPTGRLAGTPDTTPGRGRRWAFPTSYIWNGFADQVDDWQTIHEPTNEYVQVGAAAFNREWTRRILKAALGTAQEGNEDGLTPVTLPAAQTIVHGSTGLTKLKMIQTLSKLQKAMGGDLDVYGPLFFFYDPDDLTFILTDTTLTSDEHTGLHALMMGTQVPGLLGFNWVMTGQNQVLSTTRTNVAYAKRGMGVGRNTEGKKMRHDERTDLSYAEQLFLQEQWNAVRIDDKLIVGVEVDTTATPP